MRLFNVADLARKAGLQRPSLYRSFGGDLPSPNLSTVLAVLDAMNLQLKVVQRKASRTARSRAQATIG
jgi:DNA-binding phage protein